MSRHGGSGSRPSATRGEPEGAAPGPGLGRGVPSAEVIALIAMGLLGSTLAETLIAAGFAVRSLLARDGHQGKRYESSWVRTP
jgi:hypothetical protein